MDENSNKDLIEKVTSSKYFGTLAEEQLSIKLSQLYQRNKWIIKALAVVIGIITFILGYKFYDINSQFMKYQERFESLQNKENSIDSLQKKFEIQLDKIQGKNQLIDEKESASENLISKQENISNKYQDFLKEKILEVNNLSSTLKNQIEENRSLMSSIQESMDRSNKISEKMNNLYKTEIKPNLDRLDERTKLIEIASSMRYIYAERSDRTPEGNEYRPGAIKLPYSSDILKAVFHEVISDENPKEILVDFYLNNDKKAINQSVFTESEGFYEQSGIQFNSTEKNLYEAIPVFIYLPPNVPFVKRIPDFVVIKVSLVQRIK